jgi:hypothetical protein
VNNELKKMRKEAAVAQYGILFRNFPGGTENTDEKIQIGKPGPHSATTFGGGLTDRLPFPWLSLLSDYCNSCHITVATETRADGHKYS